MVKMVKAAAVIAAMIATVMTEMVKTGAVMEVVTTVTVMMEMVKTAVVMEATVTTCYAISVCISSTCLGDPCVLWTIASPS